MSQDEFLGVKDASELLGVSRQAVHALVRRGRLSGRQLAGRTVLRLSEVLALGQDEGYRRRSRSVNAPEVGGSVSIDAGGHAKRVRANVDGVRAVEVHGPARIVGGLGGGTISEVVDGA
jgi:hypothetical protein